MFSRFLLLTFLTLVAGSVIGQTSTLNELRIKSKRSGNVEDSLMLCHAFAQNGMIDSSDHYLKLIKLSSESSAEAWVLKHLSVATIESYYGKIDIALNHYDSIFKSHDLNTVSEKLKHTAYLQTLKAYSYNVECERGLELAQAYLNICTNGNLDSLAMITHTYVSQFRECLELPDSLVQQSLKSARDIANLQPHLMGPLYYELGLVHYYFERLPAAIESYLIAEHNLKAKQNADELFELYVSFSDAYDELNDFERSKEYLYKAEKTGLPDKPQMGDYYNVFGWTFYRLGQLDSARYYINKSQNAYKNYQPGNPDIAYPYGNLGLIHRLSGSLDSATHYSIKAKRLFESMGYLTGAAEALNNLGFIALKQNVPQEALEQFKEAKAIAVENNDLFEEMNALEGMIEAYSSLNPKMALSIYPDFIQLKMHFQSKEDAMKAMQKEAAFHESKSKDEIKKLQLESELKSLEIDKKNFRIAVISIGLILALALAGVFYFYWYQHQKLAKSLQESNEINQRIISMISHDFRGPLNNIKLTLELVQSDDIEMSEFTVLAKDLYRQSSEVALMFDSFVGWAMSQKDGYTPFLNRFQWSEVIKEVINISEPLAQLKQISLKVNGQENTEVHTDKMAVSLILRNLIANAIKYSHKSSSIEVDYKTVNGNIVTNIIDHGIGMSKEHLNRILTTGGGSSLGTNKEYGAGLGLRMVIKYVNGLGGSISATSEEGVGTTFTISIPAERV